VDVALRAGALGARMTGGGFGGAIIALIDRDSTAALTQAAEQAFADAGMPPPEPRPSLQAPEPARKARQRSRQLKQQGDGVLLRPPP
jgi:hypothetical protein